MEKRLLIDLLELKSPSGDESLMTDFLIQYIQERKSKWKVIPEMFFGEKFHNCLLLKFGKPRTAVFAHIDTIGFSVRYSNELVPIGSPEVSDGDWLVGEDSKGPIECKVSLVEDTAIQNFPRGIDRGTCLSYKQNIRISEKFIEAAYLDNRLGVYTALKLCENLENGWIVFSTYEEQGGGSMPFLLKFIQETSPVTMALIADITWITNGIAHHNGVVISYRDRYIPRKKFVDRIITLMSNSGIPFQVEVEGSGSSDGREIQFSPYLIDWCFIGAAEDNVHTPNEKVSITDLESMVSCYSYLLKHL